MADDREGYMVGSGRRGALTWHIPADDDTALCKADLRGGQWRFMPFRLEPGDVVCPACLRTKRGETTPRDEPDQGPDRGRQSG